MSAAQTPHPHPCRLCGFGGPWCCRHRWTIGYTAVVATLTMISSFWEHFS